MTYNIINIDLSIPRVNQVYNLTGNSIKVLNATSDCFIQFDDTTQDPINLLLVDEIKIKFKKFYLSNMGMKNQSITIIVSENFNLNDRIGITEYINTPHNVQFININNSEPNVQIELNLTPLNFSGVNDTGSNIRITDENYNPLPFYLDSFDKTSKTGKIFFKTPNKIINKALIFNVGLNATSVSDGNATFEFFDDFTGTIIDNNKWNIIDSTGWSVINGELRGSNTSGRLLTRALFSSGIIQEVKARTVTLALGGQTIGGFWVNADKGFNINQNTPDDIIRNNTIWGNIGDVIPEDNIDFIQQFIVSPTTINLKIIRLDTNIVTYNVIHTSSIINEPIMLGRRPDDSLINRTYETYWDWIRVRKVTAATAVIV